jgi:hypothetical protein
LRYTDGDVIGNFGFYDLQLDYAYGVSLWRDGFYQYARILLGNGNKYAGVQRHSFF